MNDDGQDGPSRDRMPRGAKPQGVPGDRGAPAVDEAKARGAKDIDHSESAGSICEAVQRFMTANPEDGRDDEEESSEAEHRVDRR